MRIEPQLALFAGLTVLLWGLWGFFGKLAIERGMPPVGIFAVEILVSFICAIGVVAFSEAKFRLLTSWNIFGLFSGMGLALGLLFYYLALQKAKASLVVPLTASYPLVSALLAYSILGERLRPPQWIGVFLIVLGTILLLCGPLDKPH